MLAGTRFFATAVLFAGLAPAAYAQTPNDLGAAARATKVEGRWQWEATSIRCENLQGTGNATIEISDGVLMRTYLDFGEKLIERYTITRVAGNAVFAIESSPGPVGSAETSFTVTGDRLMFFRPQRQIPGQFMKPASTQGYRRCP